MRTGIESDYFRTAVRGNGVVTAVSVSASPSGFSCIDSEISRTLLDAVFAAGIAVAPLAELSAAFERNVAELQADFDHELAAWVTFVRIAANSLEVRWIGGDEVWIVRDDALRFATTGHFCWPGDERLRRMIGRGIGPEYPKVGWDEIETTINCDIDRILVCSSNVASLRHVASSGDWNGKDQVLEHLASWVRDERSRGGSGGYVAEVMRRII